MCANCGCGLPEDKHGDERNITWSEIQTAGEANDLTPEQVLENFEDMGEQQREKKRDDAVRPELPRRDTARHRAAWCEKRAEHRQAHVRDRTPGR